MDIISKLKEMKGGVNSSVKELIDILISNMEIDEMTNDEASRWMYDVCRYGSSSGVIPNFIYYKQCNDFYRRNFENIHADLNEEFNCKVELDVWDIVHCWISCWTEILFDQLYVVK